MLIEYSQGYNYVQDIRYHEPKVAYILERMTLTFDHMGDKLVHATDNDVDEVDGDYGGNFPRREVVVAVAKVENNGGDQDFCHSEHEVVGEVPVQFLVVVVEE